MTTFALVHGAWHGGWAFDPVAEHLRAAGHGVVAPDLPCEDQEAGAAVEIGRIAGAGHKTVLLEPVENPRQGRIADAGRLGQRAGRNRLQPVDDPQRRKLRAGHAEFPLQQMGMDVGGPGDAPQSDDNLVFDSKIRLHFDPKKNRSTDWQTIVGKENAGFERKP